MRQSLLQEYIDRRGLVTYTDLLAQTGAEAALLWAPVMALIAEKQIFYCRFAHGHKTLLSRHLLLCLQAVRPDPMLSRPAQEIYGYLSGNRGAELAQMRAAAGLKPEVFGTAFRELQQCLCAVPLCAAPSAVAAPLMDNAEENTEFLWATDMQWLANLPRPLRYENFPYCLSEMNRLLEGHFTSREINEILYRGCAMC